MNTQVPQRDFTGKLLPQTLSELKKDRETGTLKVITLAATRDFLFVDGEVRAARSTAETEMLGSWLVTQGVISEVFKQSALLSQEGGDSPPFGHILVSSGATDKETLERHLETLALTILERASSKTHKQCVFLAGPGRNQLDTLPEIATPQLILIAARAVVNEDARRKALGPDDQLVSRTGSLDTIVQEFNLHVAEAVILGKLHRDRTLDQLKKISTLEDDEFHRAVYALKAAGIVDFISRPTRGATARVPVADSPVAPPEIQVRSQAPRPRATSANTTAEAEEIMRLARMINTANHYDFLGINQDASYQQIFDIWDAFQAKYSPERASEPHLKEYAAPLTAVYKHAQDAFEVISSPVKRPRYDRIIRSAETTKAASDAPSGSSGGPNPAAARAAIVTHNLSKVDKLIRTGDVYSAVSLLEQTCDLDPQPSSLLKLAKLMLLNPNWTNRALEKMRRAVEIDPAFVDGWLAVADFWHNQKSAERERKALERALVADPEHLLALDRYRQLRGPEELQTLLDRVRGKKNPDVT